MPKHTQSAQIVHDKCWFIKYQFVKLIKKNKYVLELGSQLSLYLRAGILFTRQEGYYLFLILVIVHYN